MKPIRVSAARFLFGLRGASKSTNSRMLAERGETAATLRIREAVSSDIPDLARLHVITWNATYAPMKGPPVEVREWQWRDAFAKQDASWFCYVVERSNGELIGFAKGTRSDNPGYEGQLNKIYLLREYQRMGLGRRLTGHVARRFLSQGINSMWLCAEANNPSCAFYEALAGYNRLNDDGTMNYGNYFGDDLQSLAAMLPSD